MPTKVPALLDYLVSAFQNAGTIGQATPPVTVYDGPPVTGADPGLHLYVGLTDPDTDGIEEAASWSQARNDLAFGRTETSVVRCVAEAWSATDVISTMRQSANGIVAAVETLVGSNTDGFGGNITYVPQAAESGTLTQNNTETGAIARISFDLTFTSYI